MELRQLQYMLAVAEERNFSRAAEKLYIAQPHLSQYILKLENQLGIRLFDRSSNPLKLTYAGQKFAAKARQILQMDDELSRQMSDIAASNSGCLSLGISPIRGAYILPMVLPSFHAQFPYVELALHEGTSHELEEWMSKGVTDLTILSLPVKNDEFDHEVIMHEEILLAMPPHHPAVWQSRHTSTKSVPKIHLTDLRDEPFILLQPGQGLRRIADTLFMQAGYKPRVILETRNYETAHALAATGMGLTFSTFSISKMSSRGNQIVQLAVVEPSLARTQAIVYRKGKYLSKFEREFIRITKEAAYNASRLMLQEPS